MRGIDGGYGVAYAITVIYWQLLVNFSLFYWNTNIMLGIMFILYL